MTDKIIVRERAFIPIEVLDMDLVAKHYKRKTYQESGCAGCVYRPERHTYTCDECSSYLGETQLFNTETIKGVEYVGLPLGHKGLYEKRFGIDYRDFKIVDKRNKPEFDFKVKFSKKVKLFDYQEKLRTDFHKKKYGLLEAPPRTGKTLTLLRICIDLGMKVLFLADQHEFITQFFDHVYGNEEEGIPKCTNIPELEAKYGFKMCGHPETDADFENFQFFGMPYQQFASKKGRERFDRIKDKIGTVVVDEVHSASAPVFARVLSMFPSLYRFGVTGTVSRKDKKDYVIRTLIGPVVARTSIEALTPTVTVHKTNTPTTKSRTWVFIMKHLCSNAARNQQIVDDIVRDLRNGRNVVVPVIFRDHATKLRAMINKEMGKDVCELFVGGGGNKNKIERKKILQQARLGTTTCVIGIRRLLQRGLNVKQWDTIYEIIPINNKPNLKQETSRVRTPLEGKKTPRVRLYVDMQVGASLGCARASLNHMIGFEYKIAKSSRALVSEVLSARSQRHRGGSESDGFDLNAYENESMGAVDSLSAGGPGSRRSMHNGL